ncbi:MAG TPA: sigma factor-like helix-turn-helix DNA-binding protein [Pseudomonas sp.]|uniref:sigma factor-like helix-turn-helix DNA-binding protein n=1 Tax=Pseudomonas sp. TaxID=306 RepID=UPI002B70E6EF|nr:sigma factor-like helix-turn-helix DNA-binding protein [Pseudomonas sp.]HTO20177.1 sigma factor-like helix-turn-helix DNA-binding protein [Pseudomonas sp.]
MQDTLNIRAAARSLKEQMVDSSLIPATEVSTKLDILVARLDIQELLILRTLPAFQELLSLIEHNSTSHIEQEMLNPADEHQDIKDNYPLICSQSDLSVTDSQPGLPHPKTPIDDVRLGGRFDKLINRLCRSASKSAEISAFERLEDILNLPIDSLLKLDGVGKAYRDDWQELKVLYMQATEFLPPPELEAMAEPIEFVRDDMRLNLTQLDTADLKVIAKLERVIGRADIRAILSFESFEKEGEGRIVGRTRSRLLQVRARLSSELQKIAAGDLNYHAAPSSLITATRQSFESVAALGEYLLGQLDNFLATLDEKSQIIFQHRWGFVDERLTLSEIGQKYDVSRERIRQLESKINEQLNSYLALDNAEIWHAAMNLPLHELRVEMADLFGCFAEPAHFHDFLAFVSQGHIASKGSSPRPPLSILDNFFAMHGSVADKDDVLQYLQQVLSSDLKDAADVLHFLHAQGQLALENYQVRPLRLGKHEAAAAVLSEHPNGLPWLDIARHANQRGISNSPFSEKIAGHGLQDSELMYVSGKGIYRHTRFVDFTTLDEPAIFRDLNTYFATSARDVAHLNEAHAAMPDLRKLDYYILRYVVKMRGKSNGIYFNGKSQADSISLNPEFELFSQKNVILEAMRKSKGPLTKNEIAQLIKSRSSRHATLYLNELMAANQVVQVDRMLYTTSEIAYEKVDLGAMRCAIETVLRRHDQPVDPSIIQCELNILQGEAYSKYFYNSLARYFSQQGYWQRRSSLFSLQPISFASLTDAINRLCKPEDSIEQNIESLRLKISISEEAARVSLYNWKAAKARISDSCDSPELEDDF